MARRSALEQSLQIVAGRDRHLDGRADRSTAVSASLVRADSFQRHRSVSGIEFRDCRVCAADLEIRGAYSAFLVTHHNRA